MAWHHLKELQLRFHLVRLDGRMAGGPHTPEAPGFHWCPCESQGLWGLTKILGVPAALGLRGSHGGPRVPAAPGLWCVIRFPVGPYNPQTLGWSLQPWDSGVSLGVPAAPGCFMSCTTPGLDLTFPCFSCFSLCPSQGRQPGQS